ncbi:MAG: metallophosphoesterase [Desulfovibrionaceae bacterium]
MLLFGPSCALFGYLLLRLVLPLPLRPIRKLALAVLLLLPCMKYPLYAWAGGSFFAPELPQEALLVMEAAYASLVILAFLTLVRDCAALALWLARRCGAGQNWRLPGAMPAQAAVLLACAGMTGLWGAWQAVRIPDVHTVEVRLRHLPPALDGMTLVQLSDLHIRVLLGKEWLGRVVNRVNALNPDIVCLTGDYNDGPAARLREAMSPLARLRARHGVFGVTGNHEYYFQAEAWTQLLKELGVDMLNNEHRVLTINGASVIVGGVPDRMAPRFGGAGPDARRAFAGAPAGPRILLAHQPRDARENTAADLQLSGHTHGGMLVFLRPLIAAFNEGFVSGLYDVNGMRLYVSPGTGLWGGFSCRVGVPAEITRLVLRPAPPSEQDGAGR